MIMRNILCIIFVFNFNILLSQEWDFDITDSNMTIQVSSDVVFLDGLEPPIGSLLGAFFINNNNNFICAGYQEWTGDQLAIALWASEAGSDNGFSPEETINWFIQVDGQSYQSSTTIMNTSPPFSDNFVSNGFGQALQLIFYSSGCSDVNACNYCESCVEFDDELCEYPNDFYDCLGECLLDSDQDGVCDALEILGCIDPQAENFSLTATEDDGSCNYIVFGCTNDLASNYNIDATNDDGSCVFCNDPVASNYFSGDNVTFCNDDVINNYTLESGADGLYDCCFYPNPGCTDDGSCFDIDGDGDLDECDDSFLYIDEVTGLSVYYQSPFPGVPAANYNPSANILVGVNYCHYFPACQDQDAMNYGYNCNGEDILSLANSYGFSVDFNEQPSNMPFSITFNDQQFEFIEEDSNCCLYYGCDDENADNFHDLDGSFYMNLPEEENYTQGSINLNLFFTLDGTYEVLESDLPVWANVISLFSNNDTDGDGIQNNLDIDPDGDDSSLFFQYINSSDTDSDTPCVYLGCTDGGDTEDGDGLIAYNYDPNANIDDGSCLYYVCEDPSSMNYLPASDVENNEVFSYCSDIDFFNNQTFVAEPDGYDDCCKYLGCIDPESYNFNPNATMEEYVFTLSSQGSTLFFLPVWNIVDGDTVGYVNTCYPIVYGCLDEDAENYNDFDFDGESNPYVTDNTTYYQLADINISETGGPFAINQYDEILEFNLSGNNVNVNTQIALDSNGNPSPGLESSVNPCQYIYGCTDPCYIEYYEIQEYNNEELFNFNSTVLNQLESQVCDFSYSYGCTELMLPDTMPTYDDGSCNNLLKYGCMDPNASNYDPQATLNDCLSCIPSISTNFSVLNPVCIDDIYGEFSFEIISGGGAPYFYELYSNNGELIYSDETSLNTLLEFNLESGDYFVDILDSQGYSSAISFSIAMANEFIIDIWESGGWLNTVSGYDSYEWTLNGNILIEDGYQIYPTVSGLYSVTVGFEYEDGTCISNTVYYDYEMFQTTSLDNHSSFFISCSPNPFLGSTIVSVENNSLFKLTICLYDSFGKKIWLNNKIINQEKSFIIDNLSAGIYYLYVNNTMHAQKIPIIVLK